MSALSPIGSSVFLSVARTWRVRSLVPSTPRSIAPTTARPVTAPDLRSQLGAVADALRAAYTDLRRQLEPARSVHWINVPNPGVPNPGSASTLAATRRANEQPPATQTSATALGLDLTSTGVSLLSSTQNLGLDITSAEAPSVLESETALGLDVSSPESASRLTSSTLGFDLSSPEAASTLTSTDEINTGIDEDSQESIDVDPDATFDNDDASLRPRFENDAQVTAGEFTVNGVMINVLANDTINTVLARINDTVAGVSASFSNDRVTLETTSTSEDDIIVADDTSGFLSAVKLADATTVRGNVRDDEQMLSKTAAFSSVTTGTFLINGVSIDLDRDVDSLSSLITKINHAGAGVSVNYDSDADSLVLTTLTASESDVVVSGDTTGFLASAGLVTANTVRGNVRDDQQILSRSSFFSGVTSGSFNVGGVSIAVDRTADTLQSILDRITNAGAGVTATFDASANKVRLTTNANDEGDIVVSDDTTGLLSAVRWATNNTTRGNVRDDQQVLASTTQFAAVTSGAFTIEGVAITVDRDTDTLQSLLARINASTAGVTATYDAGADRLRLLRNGGGATEIELTDDDTGFLAAAYWSDAETEHNSLPDDQRALSLTTQFASVTSGSFTVNGSVISVDPSQDSLTTILARINSANAGVNATYDSDNDRLVLSEDNAGTGVLVDNDTTGFLSAAHLPSGAIPININPVAAFNATGDDGPLFERSRSVTAGSFEVNGISIAVLEDDSVNSILAKISASTAGVTATFDPATQRVRLTAKEVGATAITINGDTSGFLAAIKLDGSAAFTNGTAATSPGSTWQKVERLSSNRQVPQDPASAAHTIADVVSRVNEVLDQIWASRDSSALVRCDAERALRAALAALPDAAKRGLTIENHGSVSRLYVDVNRLKSALAHDINSVQSFFQGTDNLASALDKLSAVFGAADFAKSRHAANGAISDWRQYQLLQRGSFVPSS